MAEEQAVELLVKLLLSTNGTFLMKIILPKKCRKGLNFSPVVKVLAKPIECCKIEVACVQQPLLFRFLSTADAGKEITISGRMGRKRKIFAPGHSSQVSIAHRHCVRFAKCSSQEIGSRSTSPTQMRHRHDGAISSEATIERSDTINRDEQRSTASPSSGGICHICRTGRYFHRWTAE